MFFEELPRHRAAALVLCAAALLCLPAASTGAETRSSVTAGYDSFIDRFTILEKDTVETLEEFYAGLMNSLSLERPGLRAELRNNFKYSDQTVDENLEGMFSIGSPSATRFDLRSNLHLKHFRSGSDYLFGNDYLQSNTHLKLKRRLGSGARLTVRSRFELLDYEEKTDFDYDYTYADLGLELEGGSYFDRFLRVGAAVGFREAPDTTALSYRRTALDLEARLSPADNATVHFAAIGDRRDYREDVKTGYWDVSAYLDYTVVQPSGRIYSLRGEAELALYDETTSIYFDTYFLRTSFRAKTPLGKGISLSLGPRAAVMLCPDFEEERYAEGTAVIGLDLTTGADLWLTVSYEPGYRNYSLEENELYSDFYLNRLSVMGSAAIPWNSSLNLFVTHDPERHSRREDDFSITLISVDVTKRF